MSTLRAAVNISTSIVKSLVKVAGFGFVADAIEGGQELYQLACSLKDETFGSAEAQMSGALRSTIKNEFEIIEDGLVASGLDLKSIDLFIGRLETATNETIKKLLDDEDALCEAITKPEAFHAYVLEKSKQVRVNFRPEEEHYLDNLLRCIADEYLVLAPNSPRYNMTILKAALEQLYEVIIEVRNIKSIIASTAEAHSKQHEQLHNDIESLRTAHIDTSTKSCPKKLNNNVWGSRPRPLRHWIERYPEIDGQTLQDRILNPSTINFPSFNVLIGHAGSGKTRLAAAIADRCESDGWSLVAWINASSYNAITNDMIALGESVLNVMTGFFEDRTVRVNQVLSELRSRDYSNCIFIFDNVQNIDDLSGLLPSGPGIHILATTRNRNGWRHQANWNEYIIKNFTRSDSIKLLQDITKDANREAANNIANYLGDLPLAIAQAGTTCAHYYQNLEDYFNDIQLHNVDRLLEAIEGTEYTTGTITALNFAVTTTLDRLSDVTIQIEAKKILTVLCFLAESGIPSKWLKFSSFHSRKAYSLLFDFSIISESADGEVAFIHRLQALALRTHLTPNESTIAEHTCVNFLIQHYKDSSGAETITTHRDRAIAITSQLSAMSQQPHSYSLFRHDELQSALFELLAFAYDRHIAHHTITLTRALGIIQSLLGIDNLTILCARNNLAEAYYKNGYIIEAIRLYSETLDHYIQTLGANHIETRNTRSNLADAYFLAGHHKRTIELYENALDNDLNSLGTTHIETLSTQQQLADAHSRSGLIDSALNHYQILVDNLTQTLGRNDVDTLNARCRLAFTYHTGGYIDDAIRQFRKLLYDCQIALGPDHILTHEVINNLVDTYKTGGHNSDIISLLTEALNSSERTNGATDYHTLELQNNLANAYLDMSDIDSAISEFEDILRKRHSNNDDTQHARYNLAESHLRAKHYDTAIHHFQVIVDELQHSSGTTSMRTQRARRNLASAYHEAGNIKEALHHLRKLCNDCTDSLGPDHLDTLENYQHLANLVLDIGYFELAIQYFDNLYRDYRRIYGSKHINTLSSRFALANAYLESNRTGECINHLKELLETCVITLGSEHALTVTVCEHLDTAKEKLEQEKETPSE